MNIKSERHFCTYNKGITLIALIVTIIILLILAAISISTLSGENGIINRAKNVSDNAELDAFKYDVNLAYNDVLIKKARHGEEDVTIDEITERLINEYNYSNDRITTIINGNVELDSTQNMQIFIGTPIVKSAITSSNGTTNYIEIRGKYYPFYLQDEKIVVGEGLSVKPSGGSSLTLNATSSNDEYVQVSTTNQSANNYRITITGVKETEADSHETVTISYGGQTATINVEVKALCTLVVSSEDENKGTVSISESPLTGNSYIKGTEITVTATANEEDDYVFKGWYKGTDTTDLTQLISGAESEYTFTLNEDTTLKAKFGEDVIDNSGSLVEGFVDDLGTRATIYLYGNSSKISSGEITITMPDSSTKDITALSKNKSITSANNYATYTVTENGTYTFSCTMKGTTTTTETKIKVRNIEKFTAIETLASVEGLSYAGGDTKAYTYRGAAVPKGYYVDTKSGTDKNPGLVITDSIIKENEEDVTGYSDGNEWVWVPVETNQTGEDRKFYVVASGNVKGADSTPNPVTYSKYGKLYSFSSARTRNAYGTFYPSGDSTTGTLGNPSGTSGYREPAILTSSSYGDKKNMGGNLKSVATQYVTDYNNMVTSVEKYGGFYIGRYELTNISGIVKEQPGTTYVYENWYLFYNQCLTYGKKITQNNTTVQVTESSMMYGSLWDATMQWLSSSYDVGYTGRTYSGYGNYKKETVTVSNDTTTITVKPSETDTKLETGQTSYTRSNNIYDLSGNCGEWTQEAYSDDNRVLRGGNYGTNSSNYTYSSYRSYNYPASKNNKSSSRPQLYIK